MKQNRLSSNIRSLAMTASLRLPAATVARGAANATFVTSSLRTGSARRLHAFARPASWTAGITASLRNF